MNEVLESLFIMFFSFVSDRWYAVCIFIIIYILAWYLGKEFHSKATKYTKRTPKEAMLLNLLCRRWERHAYQVASGISVSVVGAFIMYLVIEMGKDISTAQAVLPDLSQEPNLIAYSEALVYVFLFSIKSVVLINARGAYNDLKESKL